MSLLEGDAAPLCLPPRPVEGPVPLVPAGTVDAHLHVFAPAAPLASPRNYTPRIVGVADWLAFADSFGIARGVLVQPSVYGFDNSVLLDALASYPQRLRGVVVIPPETSRQTFDELHASGVRGVRINTRNLGGLALEAAGRLLARIAPLGWVLDVQIRLDQLEDLAAIARASPGPILIDHLGFIPFDAPVADAHVSALQRLLDAGRGYVKITAPYRLTRARDLAPFGRAVRRLSASHPERLIWGSDWPHTELFEAMPEDAALVARTLDWLGDDVTRQRAMAVNAAALFWQG